MSEVLHVYVDVDDTLVHTDENGQETPKREVLDHICELHRQGVLLYCWSNGGEEHAREVAQRYGVDKCFTGFLRKPQIFIDDQRSEEWPHFVHVAPDKLRSLDEYRVEVAAKTEGEK